MWTWTWTMRSTMRRTLSTKVPKKRSLKSASAEENELLVSSVFAKVAGAGGPLDGLQRHFTPAALGNRAGGGGEQRLKLLHRLDKCSPAWLSETCAHLRSTYAIEGRRLLDTLGKHEDWSPLGAENMRRVRQVYRECGVDDALFAALIECGETALLDAERVDRGALRTRLDDLNAEFFTRAQLERALPRSPRLLVDNMHAIRYKYAYVYMLMGLDAKEMCVTRLFMHSIEHIRARHLFVARAGFYDRPDKKGATRCHNPRLVHIVDSGLDEFLRLCTRSLMTRDDYRAFCDYLSEERFDDELLGHKMGRSLRNQLLHDVRVAKREEEEEDEDEYERDDDDDDEEEKDEKEKEGEDAQNVK